jgi:outer membrane lipoprotein-sorting protein
MLPRPVPGSKAIPFLLLFAAVLHAQSADDVFKRFLATTSGWKDMSYLTTMTTRMMGQSNSMQSKTVVEKSGRMYQEILGGPVRVATSVSGDTLRSKDLQTGKISMQVLPGTAATVLEQSDPSSRLNEIRKASVFQIFAQNDSQTILQGTPRQANAGYTNSRMAFRRSSGVPAWCELLDSAGRTTARLDFGWTQVGAVQVLSNVHMLSSPPGTKSPVDMTMQMTQIKLDRGVDPSLYRLGGAQ